MRQWTDQQRKRQAAVARKHKPWRQSTGPRTVSGKARSRYNALKHGMRSRVWSDFRKAMAAQQRFLGLINAALRAERLHHIAPKSIHAYARSVTNELLSAVSNLLCPDMVFTQNITRFVPESGQIYATPMERAYAA